MKRQWSAQVSHLGVRLLASRQGIHTRWAGASSVILFSGATLLASPTMPRGYTQYGARHVYSHVYSNVYSNVDSLTKQVP